MPYFLFFFCSSVALQCLWLVCFAIWAGFICVSSFLPKCSCSGYASYQHCSLQADQKAQNVAVGWVMQLSSLLLPWWDAPLLCMPAIMKLLANTLWRELLMALVNEMPVALAGMCFVCACSLLLGILLLLLPRNSSAETSVKKLQHQCRPFRGEISGALKATA